MKPTDFDGEMFAFDHALVALDQALHEADLPYVTELSVRSTCLRRLAKGEWRMATGEWLQLINELTGVNPNDHQATRP